MENKTLIIIGIMLLILVLIGVTIIEPVVNHYPWIQPFVPMIIITGFFTFIVSITLFLYGIISKINKKGKL